MLRHLLEALPTPVPTVSPSPSAKDITAHSLKWIGGALVVFLFLLAIMSTIGKAPK